MAGVAIVTGTSGGIGLEVALALSARNYTVVATLRTPSAAPESLRSKCDVQQLDVSDDASAKRLTEYVESKYKRCDVLINNAGWGAPGTLETVDIDQCKDVFEVNVWGVVRMVQHLLPLMRSQGGGLIMTVSSTSGVRGVPCADVYTGSKFAIEGMMESFRYSLLKDNIRINIVNPGPTDTNFSKRFRGELKMREQADKGVQAFVKKYVDKLEERNENGQSARECALGIVDVVEREAQGERRFWNATSQYGNKVIHAVKAVPDGLSSGEYKHFFEEALATWNQVDAERD